MIDSRSSNGMKADFIALIVAQRKSSSVHPAWLTSNDISRVIDVPLINLLSVLTVTRNLSRFNNEIGCSAMDSAAPVWTLLLGHISSGIRRSRTYDARPPRVTSAGSAVAAYATFAEYALLATRTSSTIR